jgi:WD40 repeat protein
MSMKSPTKYPKLGVCNKIAFSPDGSLLATLSSQVTVWDMASAKAIVKVRPLSSCSRVAWSPDGKQLAVTNTQGHTVVLDPRTGKVLRDLKNANPAGSDGADPRFSACGRFLVAGTWDGTLKVFNMSDGKLTFSENFPHEMIAKVAPINGGMEWLVLHKPKLRGNDNFGQPNYLSRHAWPFQTGAGEKIGLPFEPDVGASAFTNDGKYAAFYVRSIEDNFQIVSLPDGKAVYKRTMGISFFGEPLQWSDDDQWLVVVKKDFTPIFYARANFEREVLFEINQVKDVSISPRGDCVAFGCEGKSSRIVPYRDVFGEAG